MSSVVEPVDPMRCQAERLRYKVQVRCGNAPEFILVEVEPIEGEHGIMSCCGACFRALKEKIGPQGLLKITVWRKE